MGWKRTLLCGVAVAVALGGAAQAQAQNADWQSFPYRNPQLSVEQRAAG